MKGESTYRVSVSREASSASGAGFRDEYPHSCVYMWGECIGNGFPGGGSQKLGSSNTNLTAKHDAHRPNPVRFDVKEDWFLKHEVQQIACGDKHAALVTSEGKLYSWGEDCGGCLGHGVKEDVPCPKLVDALSMYRVEFVACGKYHTCAITQSGEIYSWGNGAQNFDLLGHGMDINHWMPKRISGSIEGLCVSLVSCGPWHTALLTSSGQLFTFGDGTFGVLGHGDRNSISTPKEIESLKGLRTVIVACGPWHTAAVVGDPSMAKNYSGKLYTWGDGDQLGHGDKEQKLVPTCVAALSVYDFLQVACGHTLTVALTTSGTVFTMGRAAYGQLGVPHADGMNPVLVEGKLRDVVVEDVACGAHHVAVLTSKSDVYTWGKGANGRLGHGDLEDKKSPTLVQALKGMQVKSIVCGSSFTAAICFLKWGVKPKQPLCSSCSKPFKFTRKQHNCYNCGFAVCHSCSSKKSTKALSSPNPTELYRVCDSCYINLNPGIGSVGEMPKKQPPATGVPSIRFPIEIGRLGKKAESSLSRVAPIPQEGVHHKSHNT